MKTNNSQIPYSKEDLLSPGQRFVYKGRGLDEIAFALGGIGTGTIALGGWGQLHDLEIFNRSSKGLQINNAFFPLYAKKGEQASVTRVLQGPIGKVQITG